MQPDLSQGDLLDLHVRTLFRLDERDRIIAINEDGLGDPPRLYVGRTSSGLIVRFRHDVPDALIHEITAILAGEPSVGDSSTPLVTLELLRAALNRHAPVVREWSGPAWYVPVTTTATAAIDTTLVSDPDVLTDGFPDLAAELKYKAPVVAVVVEGAAVATCCSSRTSVSAAEAGVETLPEYRGRGYAAAVVARWAGEVRSQGRIPLYSTSWDNLASQGVARRLGLVFIGSDVHFT
jgi:RimJ/RimL family protein N-acetyltransferase